MAKATGYRFTAAPLHRSESQTCLVGCDVVRLDALEFDQRCTSDWLRSSRGMIASGFSPRDCTMVATDVMLAAHDA